LTMQPLTAKTGEVQGETLFVIIDFCFGPPAVLGAGLEREPNSLGR
jgi:hypothetical protein